MRHLLQGCAAALVVLLAGTTVARAQTDDPVKTLTKLVQDQGPVKKDDAEKYAADLNAAINKLTTLAQFNQAMIGIDWKDIRFDLERLDKEILDNPDKKEEKELEKGGYTRLRDIQATAYNNLADRYRKVVEADLATAKVERQRVIALSVLDLSQGGTTTQKATSNLTRRYARAASAKMIPNLKELTKSTDPVVNETVAAILARAQTEWGEKAVADAIKQLLIDNPATASRLAMSRAIGTSLEEMAALRSGPQKDSLLRGEDVLKATTNILPLLGQSLKDKEASVRVQSMFDFQYISEALANPSDEWSRSNLFKDLIAAMVKQVAGGPIETALSDARPLVRTLAGLVIEDLAKARTVLKSAPEDPLSKGLKDTIPALEKATKDSNIRVRITALDALGLLRELAQPAGKTIAAAVADPDRFVRWSATRALRLIGGQPPAGAIANLATLLADPDPHLQREAAMTLTTYGPAAADAVAALGANSTHGDPDARLEMLKALAAIGEKSKAAIPDIQKSLALTVPLPSNGYPPPFARSDPMPNLVKVRQQAVVTLSKLGSDAKVALQDALADPDQDVRRSAGEALLNIKDK